MRPSKVVAACAVSVLAMVFSVQQGEYGPLVVYKLQVPKPAAPASAPLPSPAAPPAVGEATYVIPSRAPRVLGTVVMPAGTRPIQAALPDPEPLHRPLAAELSGPAAPEAAEAQQGVVLHVPDRATVLRIIEDAPVVEAMVNVKTGDVLTLQQVHDEASWRHDTAEKLRDNPFTPRF